MTRSFPAQRVPLVVLAMLCALVAPGCGSIAAVQTGRALEPGQVQVQIGGGNHRVTTETRDTTVDAQGNTVTGSLVRDIASGPAIEGGARVGLTKGLDGGLKTVVPLGLTVDLK
ncbi:MAG: hypothetical protein H6747_16345, partial [Deltaproteobacteria bacterium]|nr:hypothetical protein [Deltaproteobacteria bacterium]